MKLCIMTNITDTEIAGNRDYERIKMDESSCRNVAVFYMQTFTSECDTFMPNVFIYKQSMI